MAFAFYIPLTGWTLYIAILVLQLRTKVFGRSESAVYGYVTLLVILCLLLRAHRIQRHRMGGPEVLGQTLIRHVVKDQCSSGTEQSWNGLETGGVDRIGPFCGDALVFDASGIRSTLLRLFAGDGSSFRSRFRAAGMKFLR